MEAIKREAGVATLAALVLAGSLALVAGPAEAAAGPRFGQNYRLISPETPGRGRDAVGMAVNPADPNHIVEADGDPMNLECDYRVSFDGGRTWSGGHLTIKDSGENPPFPTPACDQNFDSGGYHHFNAGIVFGSGQNVYVTFSAHRGAYNRPESMAAGGAGDDGVVARSTDGGRTFHPAVVAIPGGGPVSQNPNLAGFGMRPGLAVQRGAGTAGKDRLYVGSWNCYNDSGCSGGIRLPRRIYVARSDDGGVTWNERVLASQPNVRDEPFATVLGTPDEQAREPSQPLVGPDGTVYIAYRNRDAIGGRSSCPPNPNDALNQKINCIVVARSLDNGRTWKQQSTGAPLAGGGHPRVAIDPSGGSQGTLYVAYDYDPPGGDPSDIAFQRSTDGGATWSPSSPPTRVNDDATTTRQSNGWVSVPQPGVVDVTWADRRNQYPGGGGGTLVDIYTRRSTDGGQTFSAPSRRVTDRPINTAVGRFGDYGTYTWYGPVGLALGDGNGLTAWMDSRDGSLDSGFQDIYLSRLEAGASVAQNTLATATTPGLSVMLSRLAYPGGPEARGPMTPITKLVVANEADVAATLAGAVLARANWGPLLLSPAAGLPAFVKADATRMTPEGAFVIGDNSSLSPAVESQVTASTREGNNVQRVAAPASTPEADRPAETARQIAALLGSIPGAEAIIANPKTPEAASASALAASLKRPVLFVDERPELPPPTARAISDLGITRALIVGGTGSVNADVEASLKSTLGSANVERLGGADQYATSEATLTEARERGLPTNVVYVADGARPIDGALLGAAVGRLGGLMLLSPSADTAAAQTRVGALGIEAAVDRVMAAVGVGGVDPVTPGGVDATPGGAGPRTPPGPRQPAAPIRPRCPAASAAANLIALTSGDDRRSGTRQGDLIFAGAGNDVVDGLGGGDCIDLGQGRDRGSGGAGDDFVQGADGKDTLSGSRGSDRLRGGAGSDRLSGGTGSDSLLGGSGGDRIAGGRGNDRIAAGPGVDRIAGDSGNDRIEAADRRADRISCGAGRDTVVADRSDRLARNCERVRRRR